MSIFEVACTNVRSLLHATGLLIRVVVDLRAHYWQRYLRGMLPSAFISPYPLPLAAEQPGVFSLASRLCEGARGDKCQPMRDAEDGQRVPATGEVGAV